MKRILFLFLILISLSARAQIICIFCYDQNDSVSLNVNNLLLNGSFENHTCIPSTITSSFCPNANWYSCAVDYWDCTGGGLSTYACIFDITYSVIPEGIAAAYFGNHYAKACSSTPHDISCLYDVACTVTGNPSGFPTSDQNHGGSLGVSLEQTVSGLIAGSTYVLEFWAGGENFAQDGLFAINVGFGDTLLSTKGTPYPSGIGTRYIVEFNATSSTHTIKFTSWGHTCVTCSELILDDVKLYTLAELSPIVPPCTNLPSAAFNTPNTLCPGSCTDFTNLSFNATTYQWSFPGASPDTSTLTNPVNICYPNTGSYDVQLIAANANGSDTLLITNYISVYPAPPPQSITQSADTLFAVQGSAMYEWFFNGNLISGATDYFYIAPASGDYNVIATDSNGCEVEAAILSVAASIEFHTYDRTIEIFPNPVSNELKIQNLKFKIITALTVSVYNVLGEKVITAWLRANSPRSAGALREGEQGPEAIIDVSELPSGLYYIELSSADLFWRAKFIKQ